MRNYLSESITKTICFFKRELVLTIAWILAIITSFIVPPSFDYLSYIDLRSLGILWSLMVIMAGLQKCGFFKTIGTKMLLRTRKGWQLALVLILLCFFFSMLITNDVALITFVPFSIFMLEASGQESMLIPVVALQTIAANLGSMLTPIGNPQNLYLYGLSGIKLTDFIQIMLPYSLLSFVLLLLMLFTIKGKHSNIKMDQPDSNSNSISMADVRSKHHTAIYGILFLISLLCVMRILPWFILALIVCIIVLIMDRRILISVDYALLFTFVGFFIFTGNVGRIPAFNNFLTTLIEGRVTEISILASQIISNVPAALLISAFTSNYQHVLIGVNLGGLGTLIASMASLISFKQLGHAKPSKKGNYLLYFTLVNALFLFLLYLMYRIIS